MHTIESVKRDLPDVRIEFNGKVYDGVVRGRKCQFAEVWIPDLGVAGFSFAWQNIVNAINNGSTLKV